MRLNPETIFSRNVWLEPGEWPEPTEAQKRRREEARATIRDDDDPDLNPEYDRELEQSKHEALDEDEGERLAELNQ